MVGPFDSRLEMGLKRVLQRQLESRDMNVKITNFIPMSYTNSEVYAKEIPFACVRPYFFRHILFPWYVMKRSELFLYFYEIEDQPLIPSLYFAIMMLWQYSLIQNKGRQLSKN